MTGEFASSGEDFRYKFFEAKFAVRQRYTFLLVCVVDVAGCRGCT